MIGRITLIELWVRLKKAEWLWVVRCIILGWSGRAFLGYLPRRLYYCGCVSSFELRKADVNSNYRNEQLNQMRLLLSRVFFSIEKCESSRAFGSQPTPLFVLTDDSRHRADPLARFMDLNALTLRSIACGSRNGEGVIDGLNTITSWRLEYFC